MEGLVRRETLEMGRGPVALSVVRGRARDRRARLPAVPGPQTHRAEQAQEGEERPQARGARGGHAESGTGRLEARVRASKGCRVPARPLERFRLGRRDGEQPGFPAAVSAPSPCGGHHSGESCGCVWQRGGSCGGSWGLHRSGGSCRARQHCGESCSRGFSRWPQWLPTGGPRRELWLRPTGAPRSCVRWELLRSICSGIGEKRPHILVLYWYIT